MDKEDFLKAIRESIKSIKDERYFATERGYQAELYCELKARLNPEWIAASKTIIESESQKTVRKHGHRVRPDIIVHVPYERGVHNSRSEGNSLVVEIKRKATRKKAQGDFRKLDSMFERGYFFGVFVNIDSSKTLSEYYEGGHRNSLHCFAVKLVDNTVVTSENH